MPSSLEYSFPRYLAAKKTIDDRALNPHVWQALVSHLPPASTERPWRVLEVGAGIGTMVERLLDRGVLAHAHYTALDNQSENIAAARQALAEWGQTHGYQVVTQGPGLLFNAPGLHTTLEFHNIDLFDFCARRPPEQTWDLLIAHAFLDLMDIPATLPHLFATLAPGGLFYFTINFDGLTLLEPAIDPEFDELIQALYHRTMDERLTAGRPSGDSRAGRHLFTHLRQAGAQILAAGSSDWVVFPQRGSYPADEAYFLHFILHTLHQALRGHPELEAERFERWIARRHAQVESGELVYIAHQLDFAGQAPPASR